MLLGWVVAVPPSVPKGRADIHPSLGSSRGLEPKAQLAKGMPRSCSFGLRCCKCLQILLELRLKLLK